MNKKDKLVVKIVNKSSNELPKYQTIGASGLDIMAFLEKKITLKPLERILVPTGIFLEIPLGWEGQIRPRSGLAYKHGITCLNTPGTIDSDYRGELKVLLVNLSNDPYEISNGDRIAQLVFASYDQVVWDEVLSLNESKRNEGGFGSTGI